MIELPRKKRYSVTRMMFVMTQLVIYKKKERVVSVADAVNLTMATQIHEASSVMGANAFTETRNNLSTKHTIQSACTYIMNSYYTLSQPCHSHRHASLL